MTRVLAIDPFHGGSHRQFLLGVQRESRLEWEVIAAPPVHWKWRMRSAPLDLSTKVHRHVADHGYPDVIFCTDMLDLPTFRGLVRDTTITNLPTVIYFHENQWSYPVSPHARRDNHFGYTNLLSALAADACWFNSNFHLTDFFQHSQDFVEQMPDGQAAHDLVGLRQRSKMIPPGFETRTVQCGRSSDQLLTIGWVSRWEYDKRPDRFLQLLDRLEAANIEFELVLLGARPRSKPKDLEEIENRFTTRIRHNGYAETAQQYWELLSQIDVVVSTADHEFFGIAVCEAIAAGAIPLLPNRLSYPELAVDDCLYQSLDDAVLRIQTWTDRENRSKLTGVSQEKIRCLSIERTVQQIDQSLEQLTGAGRETLEP